MKEKKGTVGREVAGRLTRDAMDAWNKGRSHSGGSMDRRWRTSNSLLLGMTFNREERKRRSKNIHRHSDGCMLRWSDMLPGHQKLKIISCLSAKFDKMTLLVD